MSEPRFSLGIDPGWKNCGAAIVKEEGGLISLATSSTIVPSAMPSRNRAFFCIKGITDPPSNPLSFFTIERYVSYQNVQTAESENIITLIGELKDHVETFWLVNDVDTLLVRAIDWKMELVKLLVKHKGFNNPSTSLDKKFSVAAAYACLDFKGNFSNDHEADAICLACLPLLREKYKK